MNTDFAIKQSDLAWLRGRNRRPGAVVTDPQLFGIAASMRRVARKYGLPPGKLLLACRAVRAELLTAYRAGIDVMLPGLRS
jgi:hypothetical protein